MAASKIALQRAQANRRCQLEQALKGWMQPLKVGPWLDQFGASKGFGSPEPARWLVLPPWRLQMAHLHLLPTVLHWPWPRMHNPMRSPATPGALQTGLPPTLLNPPSPPMSPGQRIAQQVHRSGTSESQRCHTQHLHQQQHQQQQHQQQQQQGLRSRVSPRSGRCVPDEAKHVSRP